MKKSQNKFVPGPYTGTSEHTQLYRDGTKYMVTPTRIWEAAKGGNGGTSSAKTMEFIDSLQASDY